MDDRNRPELEDLEAGESFGAELLDSDGGFPLARLFDPAPFSEAEQDRWRAFTFGEPFIGDVGRDPFGGAWPMGAGCND